MWADEVSLVGQFGIPENRNDNAHDSDQCPSLLEPTVFLEAGVEVTGCGMKWIGIDNVRFELVWGDLCDSHLLGTFQRCSIGIRDLFDLRGGGCLLKNSGAKNMINLVGIHLDWINTNHITVYFLFQVVKRL